MEMDVRTPIGVLFVLYGLLLAAFGLLSSKTWYERSLNVNVNLYWGLLLLIIGIVLLWMASRATRKAR